MAAPSREQFFEQVSQIVHDKFPLVRITRGDEPFSVRINGHVASLENLYRMAVLKPGDCRRHVERWVVELLRAAEGTPDRTGGYEELKERIMPMILAEKPDGGQVQAHRSTVTAPFIAGLKIGYAIDSDRTIAYLPEAHFDQWDISRDELHETAVRNLVVKSEAMQAHAAQDESGRINLILFQVGDGYDASRILLPTLHERLREHLGSPFAAAVPNRDILLCFRNDTETIDRLRVQIADDYRRLPHGVSDKLLLVTPDGIAPRD